MSKFKPGEYVRILSDPNGYIGVGQIRRVLPYLYCYDDEVLVADHEPPLSDVDGHYFHEPDLEYAPFGECVRDASTGEVRVVNETTGGAKGSKPERFSLLPWDVLGKLAEHYGKGAKKYAAHNWRKGYDWSLSIDALGRHLKAFIEGETYDPETGSHHMLAVMFHAAALVYFTDAFPQLDDRRNSQDGSANDADS